MTNDEIARKLLEHARTLPVPANLFRIRAYRHAAMVVQGLDRPVLDYLDKRAHIPGIGEHLAFTIATLAMTGEFVPWSERLSRTSAA